MVKSLLKQIKFNFNNKSLQTSNTFNLNNLKKKPKSTKFYIGILTDFLKKKVNFKQTELNGSIVKKKQSLKNKTQITPTLISSNLILAQITYTHPLVSVSYWTRTYDCNPHSKYLSNT